MKKLNKKGFTLVEVLIAIIIFGVGVVSVLGMVIYNITVADNMKNQVSGTLLAKEGIEILYNIKDSNKKKDIGWNVLSVVENGGNYDTGVFFEPGDGKYYLPYVSFDANIGFGRYDVKSIDSTQIEKSKLYFHSGTNINSLGLSGLYDYNSINGINTNFSRYVTFDKLSQKPTGDDETFVDENISKVTSNVVIERGRKRTISIETFMGNN